MEVQGSLNATLREQLLTLENELDLPLFVKMQAGEVGPQCAQVPEGHIAVLGWSRVTERASPCWTTWYGLPGELFASGESLADTIHDVYNRPDPEQCEANGTVVYEVNDLPLAEIAPGRVAYFGALNTVMDTYGREFDFEEVFANPIRIAADPEFVTAAEERRSQREAEAFIRFCQQAPHRVLANVRERVSSEEANNSTWVQRLADTRATLRQLRAEAIALESTISAGAEQYEGVYETIKRHPRIEGLRFDADTEAIVVTTECITITHPETDETRTLGRIEATIPFGTSTRIEIKNLDHPRNGRPHPHVTESGAPCWGNLDETIAEYHARGELVALVEIIIAYLESFNPNDDYGLYGNYWFGQPDVVLTTEDLSIDDIAAEVAGREEVTA